MSNSSRVYGLYNFSNIADLVVDFTGRIWVFQEIDRWLKEDSTSFFLLTGEPGSGKSAVAARLAQFAAGEVVQPLECQQFTPGFLDAIHFCRATASDWVDPRSFSRSLALQLTKIDEYKRALLEVGDQDINIDVQQAIGVVEAGATVTGVNITIQGLNGQESFNRTVLDPLRSIYAGGYDQPLVILIDSLDEALTSKTSVNIVDLLEGAQGLDRRVRFILTSRPEPRVENRFPLAPGLSLSDPAHAAENHRDIAEFVNKRFSEDHSLASMVAGLSSAEKATTIADIRAKADGNFQYVTFLLSAIASGLQPLDKLTDLPSGLDGLYHESMGRVVDLGKKDWSTVYKPFLGVLTVAQEPLTLDLLKNYTGSETSLWDVYMDLKQFIEDVPESPVIGEEALPEDHYQLYHQSVIDFLHRKKLTLAVNGQKKVLDNNYFVEAEDWHARIVAAGGGSAEQWSQVDWGATDYYTLRYLATHVHQLGRKSEYRIKLHKLLETRAFIDRHLAFLGKPYLVLDDLQLGLNLALKHDDLAQVWRHIREIRRVVRDQLDFEKFQEAVETGNQTGDYVHVTERTALYSFMPNSQALARLYIAWNAAASDRSAEAAAIAKKCLDGLSPRGRARSDSRQAGAFATEAVEDAIGETLQRLLIRIAQTAEETINLQGEWLKQAMSPWSADDVALTVGRISETLESWGELFSASQMSEPIESLLDDLQTRGERLYGDANAPNREAIYFFQKRLAAALFNSRTDPRWLENVNRCVQLLALDDYPSYREMALSWIAASALAHEDTELAQQALAAVLGGMFKPSPGFWGDTVAAAMDGMWREDDRQLESDELSSLLEHVEATAERGMDPTVLRKMPDIIKWRRKVGLPDDPWSFCMRRGSALASVLRRRNDMQRAEIFLEAASAVSHQGSYAGFRALARLSLACRWLEWHRLPEADGEIDLAEEDAGHMLDDVLRQERLRLIEKMRAWINEHGTTPSAPEVEEALAQLQRKRGLERGLYTEFLSAKWFDDAARLKRLLPLSLDDATTTDAVLGRLLGVEALQIRAERPFYQLVKEFNLGAGLEGE